MGETTSDTLVRLVDPAMAVIGAGLLFIITLGVEFWWQQFNRWRYWAAVTMVSVFGTMAADAVHIVLDVPYLVPTVVFLVVLAFIFSTWRLVEGTLSIHSIDTPRHEAFYWAAVLGTFALGTATGDMTATTLGIGYLNSGLLFLVAFAALAVWHFGTRRNPIASSWIAYILAVL